MHCERHADIQVDTAGQCWRCELERMAPAPIVRQPVHRDPPVLRTR